MIEHDEYREKEVQFLCNKIINELAPDFIDDDYGPYRYKCPFCYEEIHASEIKIPRNYSDEHNKLVMSKIEHDTNCIYKLAKGLLTKE